MTSAEQADFKCRLCAENELELYYCQGAEDQFRYYRCTNCQLVNLDLKAGLDQTQYTDEWVDPTDDNASRNRDNDATYEFIRRTIVRSQLREYDVVGRYGGEEFLLLLPGCGPESGRMIADRVRERIQAVTTLYGALTLSVTASFGLASTSVAGMEPSSQIEAADSALYRAKSNGRNRVEESLPGTRERSATQSLRDSAHRS